MENCASVTIFLGVFVRRNQGIPKSKFWLLQFLCSAKELSSAKTEAQYDAHCGYFSSVLVQETRQTGNLIQSCQGAKMSRRGAHKLQMTLSVSFCSLGNSY